MQKPAEGLHMDARTKLLGLVGSPVEHSLSPVFMNFVLQKLGLNYCYAAFDVAPQDLRQAMEGLKVLGFKGANVTIPHKNAVIRYLDYTDAQAQVIGAVNCMVCRDMTLHGCNTDWHGFLRPLKDRGIHLENWTALVLGCGGAARGVVFALVTGGIGRIMLVNRTRENALRFIEWCKDRLEFEDISYLGEGCHIQGDQLEQLQQKVNSSNIIINTTPVGMHPRVLDCPLHSDIFFNKEQIVYDLIYNPLETVLLHRAGKQGAKIINGLEMLILQGLYSLAIWFPEKKQEIFSIQHSVIDYTENALPAE
ncbi:MAG: shikimate dehydrogenase [Spirochaetota bacterium]